MRNTAWYSGVFLAVVLVMAGSIWGPEALAKYKDKGILNQPHMENVEEAGEGYRYRLNANEKLYILSNCISSHGTSIRAAQIPAKNPAFCRIFLFGKIINPALPFSILSIILSPTG